MLLVVLEALLCALAFMFGACIFSFLNVIVYRLPRKLSFVKGFSMCPSCGQRLKAPDLVPVFSYLFLRGKCRYCKAAIGVRDTLVEILGGVLALLSAWKYIYKEENIAAFVVVFLFFCILTVVAFIDKDTMEIPDGCSIAIVLLAIAAALLPMVMPEVSLLSRVIGLVCVSLPMLLVTLAIPGAFGGGDIKLMAAAGLFLGWKLTVVSAAIAVLTGGIYGCWLLAAHKAGRKDQFAFGPFLCAGLGIGVLVGTYVIDWYMGFLVY